MGVDLDLTDLPPVFRETAELIGLNAALALVERYPGVPVRVPHAVDAQHELARLLGLAAAQSLCDRYGGDVLLVPRCAAAWRRVRNAQIRAQHAEGWTARELALHHRLTERAVWLILAEERAEFNARQQALF